jgi:hypothetical protein
MPIVGVPLIAAGLATAPWATLASLGGGFIGDVVGEELEEHHGFKKGTRTLTGLAGSFIGPGIIKTPKILNSGVNYIKRNSPGSRLRPVHIHCNIFTMPNIVAGIFGRLRIIVPK